MLSGLLFFQTTCKRLVSGFLGAVSEYGRVESLARSNVSVRHEVAVAVHSRRDRRVSELLLRVLEVLALVDEQRCKCVAEIVIAYLPKSGNVERWLEYRLRYVYTDRAAVKDIERFLHKELKYPGQYFGGIEDHKHRGVPHAHVLMEDCIDWRFVWQRWKSTRGLFCSRPAESGTFYYVVKYTLKDGRCAERVFERLALPELVHVTD